MTGLLPLQAKHCPLHTTPSPPLEAAEEEGTQSKNLKAPPAVMGKDVRHPILCSSVTPSSPYVLGKHRRAFFEMYKLSYWKILFHLSGKLGYLETVLIVFWNRYIDNQWQLCSLWWNSVRSLSSPCYDVLRSSFSHSLSGLLSSWLAPGRNDWLNVGEGRRGDSVRLFLAPKESKAAGRWWEERPRRVIILGKLLFGDTYSLPLSPPSINTPTCSCISLEGGAIP